ncbi:MAG TPA: thiamine pyrophosphate-binding protein [Vicinamibacteria bacterium]|nr:thiamine pyrophosphate-binding protein [Vicinamibacteria bacterium]
MRETAKKLLNREIGRRAFIGQLTALGVAPKAASMLARSTERVSGSRIVENLTGGEVMAELLVDWKVPYVFGLGGSEEVGFLDALVDRLSLQYVHGLHEASVMAMADGYARATGEVPIMNLHSVAGAGYALAPMVNAFKDYSPVVVTVGRQSTEIRGTNAFLESVNLHELPREYTQWSWDVMNAETIPEVIRRAFVLAEMPPGGPTFVTFSKDLWEERVPRAEILPRSRSRLVTDVPPDATDVERIADLLVDAQFPVIAVGKEGARLDPSEPLMELAERLGMAVFQDIYMSHTPMVFPSSHPHFCGMFRDDPEFPERLDVFWALGGTMFGFGSLPAEPAVPREARVIHTGLAPEVGRTYPVDVGVIAGSRATVAAVLEEVRGRNLSTMAIEDRRERVRAYHHSWRARLDEQARRVWDQSPISNERLMVELNRRIAPDALVVSELVTSEPYVPYYLDIAHERSPRRRNLATSGGVLGWGVPAAIGAHIGVQDREVWALVGDGAFQFGVQSLWTAARYEVPVGVVIWKNGQYQANRRFLHAYGGRAAETGKYVGVNLGSPEIDSIALAKGYGVEGERVDEAETLGAALDRCQRAMHEGRPYVVEVAVERRFGGAESSWYDFFSVAKREPRRS